MMKKASKKKLAARNKANNDARRVAGKPPDGRTKAGRAWKAAQAERARRARNREADKLAAKAAVTGSWVDLKDHPANKAIRDAYSAREASNFIEQSKNAQKLLEMARKPNLTATSIAAAQTYIHDEIVENAHNPGRAVLLDVPTDMEKLKASGMYWELFPEGWREKPTLVTDAVGGPGGKATVAYWRVGV